MKKKSTSMLPLKENKKITSKKILEDCQNILRDKTREKEILEWPE